jgi:hypothetical protein
MPKVLSRREAPDLNRILQRLNPNIPAGVSADALPRIARDSNALRQLRIYLKADPVAKVLLTGHIGVGKSTELFHLAREMDAERWVIECSVGQSLGVHNVNTFALLLVLLRDAMHSWVAKLGDVPAGLVQELVGHLNLLLKENTRSDPGDDVLVPYLIPPRMLLPSREKISRGIRRGADLVRLYDEMLLRAALRSASFEQLVALDLTPVARSCEIVLKELEHTAAKPILLVIDDLDKVRNEDAKVEVFLKRAMVWQRLPCGIVSTAPLDMSLSRSGPEMDQIWFDVQVLDPLRVPVAEGLASALALQPYRNLLRSAGAHEVFSVPQCRKLAIASSGLLRTFVSACAACVARAIEGSQDHIRDYHIDLVLRDLTYRWRGRLEDSDYAALVAVLDSGGSNVPAALGLLRDGVLIRDGAATPKRQFRLANWAEPLLEAYRRRPRLPRTPINR